MPKREPIMWTVVIGDVGYILTQVVDGNLTVANAIVVGVSLLVGWLARGEYTPYRNRGETVSAVWSSTGDV